MADYFDQEAEESSDEDYEVQRKSKKVYDSDDEEEDEKALEKEIDEEGNIAGLVDDDVIEEDDDIDDDLSDEDSSDEERDRSEDDDEKRRKKRKRTEHRLEDDDFDLIEENLGVKLKKRKKFSRLRTVSSDEEQSDEEADDRAAIRNELFQDDDESVAPTPQVEPDVPLIGVDEEEELSEESDVDDFIVDDNGEPISKPMKGQKRRSKGDSALQNLQDIFGGDFDFSDFDKYGPDYADEEIDDDSYYDDQLEDDDLVDDDQIARRAKKKAKKSRKKKSIFDFMEPDTLERGFYTDVDTDIRTTDVPERFQLRGIPMKPAEENELEMEAEWIYKYCFLEPTVTKQDIVEDMGANFSSSTLSSLNRKPQSCVGKIQDALNFMRNQQFETPFIAFYRKEYVEPELNIHDIFKIYHWDEKWTQLNTRKANLTRLLQKMQTFQYEQISADPDKPLGDNVRALTDADIERIQLVQTMEELKDVYAHFLLYYGRDIPKMQNAIRVQRQRERAEENPGGDVPTQASDLKQASRRDMYSVCLTAGLGGVANKFGLTPEQFGENLRDNYQRHETEQYPAEPLDLAQDFLCPQFSSKEAVLEGARYMVAMQLAREPLVRQCVRQTFLERAKISIEPTKKGKKDIDEQHPCHKFKWLSNKPAKDMSGTQYLHIHNAESEGLITVTIHIDMKNALSGQTYFEEIKQLYYRDEFSHLVQEWNAQRSQVIEFMLTKILYKEMTKELRTLLFTEAKDGIKELCALKMRSYLAVAPYQSEEREYEEEEDEEARGGSVIMGVSYSEDRETATFAAVVSGMGEVQDYLRLPFMRFRRNSSVEEDVKRKTKDIDNLKKFIAKRKPHIIVIGAEDRFAITLQEDVQKCVKELEDEGSLPTTAVELISNDLAVVYAATARAQTDFRDFPSELRQAISLARRMQDPMLEFSQLCTTEEDLMCLKLHSLQDHVGKDELLQALVEEFVFRANEVGVDVNQAIFHPHTSTIVQFVCGLGPRKAAHLLKVLKQKNGRLENRSNLVTVCKMGPKIFINCAGFIKIDTKSIIEDSTDAYIEILDGLRVHPETYEWARKMAVDALEYDESAEDANPSSALSEILESPERLKDLDLDAFAEELERQGYGNKGITLYDIRNELNSRYKDFRQVYRPPTAEEKFELVTKESLANFREGKLVACRVVTIAHRRPKSEQLDQAEPHKDEETGLWSCSFCKRQGFADLAEVWSHLDTGECLGKAVGVRLRLENGISGFVPTDKLSDKQVDNPEDRVKVGMTVHGRLTKIDIERYQVDVTCKGSDLRDEGGTWKQQLDTYYDYEAELADKHKAEDASKNSNRTTYIKRVIAHPAFHNIDFRAAEKLMVDMDQGDTVIRPSSKGSDHLTATWKVAENVCAHIDIKEEGKENAFTLGRSLWIGNEEFEDLDEIIARFIQPMAANVRDLVNHKNYREVGGKKEVLEDLLKQAKKTTPSRIPYFMAASRTLPGKFLLSYMPRVRAKHEYVTATVDGYRYRGQTFTTLSQLFKWFKDHFRDPIPSHLLANTRTPQVSSDTSGTPKNRTPSARAPHTPSSRPPRTPHTPREAPLHTPHSYTPNAAYITPGGYGTPSHPQDSPGGGMYPPKSTPKSKWAQPVGIAPKKTPRPKNAASQDWGKAAQDWAKKHQSSPRMTPTTPRGPRTPAGSYKGTPHTPQSRTPRGQRTPNY